MLYTIEWGDDWAGCTWFAAKVERDVRIVEPEAQVVLMSCTKCCCTTRRDGKCLFVEDALYRHTACASTICFQITLIPGDSKWRLRELDHEEIIASIGSESTYTDFHQII